MNENFEKAEFLNYLLFEKHNILKKTSPIIFSHIISRTSEEIFREFKCDFNYEQLNIWLEKLKIKIPLNDLILEDILFGMLYSSDLFIKLFRNKNIKQNEIVEFYKNQLDKNKKYIMEFNKNKSGKINITAPIKVVTRFPPEPSGYLHIGHAKAALLNQMMAKNGELIIRFDDTNPEKESKVFEMAILEDLKLLKITKYRKTYSSDYFDIIYEYAIKLIKDGKAYVDNTSVEIMREERTNGIKSKNRDNDFKMNLKIFQEMKEGMNDEYCLRAKISIDNVNKAMRDPVIYRVVNKSHHRTGNKYKIYPTYDFTVPILDSIEGITLSLRSNEYRDRNIQYFWFIEALKLENKPKIHDFSRLCFENSVVSKRKMKYFIENGYLDGWDDPRLCTIRGIIRAGMTMEALIDYIKLQGVSQKTSVNSWDKIWAMNKNLIDRKSARYSAVPENKAVVCKIDKFNMKEIQEVFKHKKNPELGTKKVFYNNEILISQEDAKILNVDEEFTLMNIGNAIVEKKIVENEVVIKMKLRLNLEGDFKSTKYKISWVSKKGSIFIKTYEFGSLLNGKDLENLGDQFNNNSKKEEFWIAENAINNVLPGEHIQIERIGFYYCDKLMEFNLVPYTKQKRIM